MSAEEERYSRRLQRSFAVVALLFGGLLGVLVPPLQVADEPAHFFSAHLVSEGDLLPRSSLPEPGALVPRSVRRLSADFRKVLFSYPRWKPWPADVAARLRAADGVRPGRVFVAFHRVYGPISYAPQAVALAAARAAGLPLWAQLYAGRLGGLVLWIVTVSLAIRLTPVLRESVWLLGLTPMALSTAASFSADTVTTALAWLYTAFVLRLSLDPDAQLGARSTTVLVLLGSALSVAKYAYAPLVAACLLVPPAAAPSRRCWWISMTTILAAPCMSLGLWFAWAGAPEIAPPLRYDLPPGSRPWSTLAADPIAVLRAIAVATWNDFGLYRDSMVGRLGQNLGAPVEPWIVALHAYGAVALALAGGVVPVAIAARHRLVAAAVVVTIYVSIQAVARLRWSLDPEVIVGFQGRYLLPIAPLALLVLVPAQPRLSIRARRVLHAIAVAAVVLAAWSTAGTLTRRYYHPDLEWTSAPGRIAEIFGSRQKP